MWGGSVLLSKLFILFINISKFITIKVLYKGAVWLAKSKLNQKLAAGYFVCVHDGCIQIEAGTGQSNSKKRSCL